MDPCVQHASGFQWPVRGVAPCVNKSHRLLSLADAVTPEVGGLKWTGNFRPTATLLCSAIRCLRPGNSEPAMLARSSYCRYDDSLTALRQISDPLSTGRPLVGRRQGLVPLRDGPCGFNPRRNETSVFVPALRPPTSLMLKVTELCQRERSSVPPRELSR